MAPVTGILRNRKVSITEISDWWRRHRGRSPEFSPLLREAEIGPMGNSDEEATGTSTEDILTSDPPPSHQKWIRVLTFPYRILFPSRTLTKFFLANIIPAISQHLIPLFYTGQIPNSSSLALAGQFTFISIVLEVIQEGITNR